MRTQLLIFGVITLLGAATHPVAAQTDDKVRQEMLRQSKEAAGKEKVPTTEIKKSDDTGETIVQERIQQQTPKKPEKPQLRNQESIPLLKK